MWITRQIRGAQSLDQALLEANPDMYSDDTLEPGNWWLSEWWHEKFDCTWIAGRDWSSAGADRYWVP